MAQGMIHRLIGIFIDASGKLGGRCDRMDFRRMAILVHRIISCRSRPAVRA